MKKNYLKPNATCVEVNMTHILAGSNGDITDISGVEELGIGGTTSDGGFNGAQAKSRSIWSYLDEE